jgi:hypothetical protein
MEQGIHASEQGIAQSSIAVMIQPRLQGKKMPHLIGTDFRWGGPIRIIGAVRRDGLIQPMAAAWSVDCAIQADAAEKAGLLRRSLGDLPMSVAALRSSASEAAGRGLRVAPEDAAENVAASGADPSCVSGAESASAPGEESASRAAEKCAHPAPAEVPTQPSSKGAGFDFDDGCRLMLPQGVHRRQVRLSDLHNGNILDATPIKARRPTTPSAISCAFESRR